MTERTIVVGVDGSPDAERALAWAVNEARRDPARLVAVHAWHIPAVALAAPYGGALYADTDALERAAGEVLEGALERVDTERLEVERRIQHGTPATALLEASEGADLIVIGSRGLGGFAGLVLGSVGQQVVRDATVPVLIVPKERK